MDEKQLVIAVDLGDTVFDRTKPRMPCGDISIPQFCNRALEILGHLSVRGHKLIVVSKIDQGDEPRVMLSLEGAKLVPDLINRDDVHFCYERADKGPIFCEQNADVCVDDRVDVLNAAYECGTKHRILFTEVHDDRTRDGVPKLAFEEVVRVARNWPEVFAHIQAIL